MDTSIFVQPAIDTLSHVIQESKVKLVFTAILSATAYLINENVIGIAVLLGMICIDWVTGILAAVKANRFNSTTFRQTVIKAVVYFMLIALFHSLEKVNPLLSHIQLDILVMTYLSVTEIISIIENVSRITDLKLPTWIMKSLKSSAMIMA